MSNIFKKFSYALLSNGTAFLVSAIVTLIAPRYMPEQSYSYFQLYVFYLTYIGLSCLGWIDGIVLRYGGQYYNKLDKPQFSQQFRLFALSQLIIGVLFILITQTFVNDIDKDKVCFLFGIAIILSMPCQFFRYLLQSVNRIEDYSKNLLLEKVIYAGLVILLLLIGVNDYVFLIGADLIGKLISLIAILYGCRDIINAPPEPVSRGMSEAKENIKSGSKLLIANNAGYFINGIVRYAIESHWSLAAFVRVSLTLNISNLLLAFVRVISIVIFPLLKRMHSQKLPELYKILRLLLMVCLFGLLCFYYPIKLILSAWLPQYKDSLIYMAILFPICIYESKTSLLIETYMKALRREKWMLWVNCITMGLSAIFTFFTVYVIENLDLAVLSIVVLLAFRCIISELMLEKPLGLYLKKDIILELLLSSVFIIFSWFIGGFTGCLLYLITYAIYLIYYSKNIKSTCLLLKSLILKKEYEA